MRRDAVMTHMASALAAYGGHLARSSGGRTTDWRGISISRANLASEYRSLVVPLRPVSSSEASSLAAFLAEFYGSHRGWVLWSVFPLDLVGGGFTLRMDNPAMAGPPATKPVEAPEVPGLGIQEVVDDAGVAAFERVRALAFGAATTAQPLGARLDARALGSGHRLWLGRLGDEVVSTGAAFESGSVNMVKNISTLPGVRSRGIGGAMTAHAMRASRRPAVLDATPAAATLYQRLGFREVGRVQFWVLD